MIKSEQHNIEIQKNATHWKNKPALRGVYQSFYRLINSNLNKSLNGDIVELGSGIGQIKEFIPECITTDMFPNPWLDRQENAYQLSFADHSLSNLILFDVFHHIEYPGNLFREFKRVLHPQGRIIIFDPYISLLSYPVYGLFHHEPVSWQKNIEWLSPPGAGLDNTPYFAAQSRATRIFDCGQLPQNLQGWHLREKKILPAWDYVFTGGFSKPQLLPDFMLSVLSKSQKYLNVFPRIFGTRILVVLEKVRQP